MDATSEVIKKLQIPWIGLFVVPLGLFSVCVWLFNAVVGQWKVLAPQNTAVNLPNRGMD